MTENRFSQQSSDYRRVEKAILFLEENFRCQPDLEEIARSVHLSKYHFHRLFKRWAGISPTQFLHFLTIEYAKQRLRESQSILAVTLDTGLSSPGRLHDLFVTFEAITPGEYKKRGAGLQITYGFHDTPFGVCLLATTQRGICSLHFLPDEDRAAALRRLGEDWPQATFIQDSNRTQPLVERIFTPGTAAPHRPFHLLLKGTNFQVNVWQALLTIPSGKVVSYESIATYIGRPGGTRAVAGAIARNPIAYLIPCHRVIGKSGKIEGYRWGTARKKAILGWEAGQRLEPEGLQ